MLFTNDKTRPLLAIFCALGWSLAYPFIKLGYAELQIDSADLGSKILFAGIRFFAAGLLVLAFSAHGAQKHDHHLDEDIAGFRLHRQDLLSVYNE